MSTVVACVTHREYTMPDDPLYIHMMAGSALMRSVPDGYTRDDTGDNISSSNRTYCELTGLYWAWKHLDADNIGICHYRRYFAQDRSHSLHMRRSSGKDAYDQILTLEEADRLMKVTDVILPLQRKYYIETNYSQYIHAHHAQDLDMTRDIIRERYPEYLAAWDISMKRRGGHRFNMFIMRRSVLDRYCTWLFSILSELEDRLDLTDYSDKDRRVFGYVAERLLDVWLEANNVRYIELPYIMTERENIPAKAVRLIARKLLKNQ